jgi:hypothetical protein
MDDRQSSEKAARISVRMWAAYSVKQTPVCRLLLEKGLCYENGVRKMILPAAIQREFVIEKLDAEVLVYDVENHRAHCLNEASALVWGLCDGCHTSADAARLLHERLGVPEDVELVNLALDRLAKAKLIEATIADVSLVSRRDLTRRLGLVGSMAVLVPAVTSLVAPTPARAQTAGDCAPLGESCVEIPCCPLLDVVVVCVAGTCVIAEP